MTNPLVAQADGSTTWSTGLGLVEDAHQISDGIRNGSWVDVTLGGVTGSLDTLAVAVDPLGSLFAWGVGWLLEHVQPLRDALDRLAGSPDEIAAHAATWRNVSAAAAETRQRYAAAVGTQTADWLGASGDAYRAHAAQQLAALDGMAEATSAISYAVEGAGLLVGLVREIVRDLIAQFVATLAVRLPQWLAAEGITLGLATPVVAGQVATLVSQWADRIQHFIRALLNSLRTLTGRLADLTGILTRLKQLLGRPAAPEFFSKSPVRTNREVLESGPGTPMTVDNVHATAERVDVDLNDVDVVIVDDPEEIRYLDHMEAGACTPPELNGRQIRLGPASFADNETLAATIAHEYTHVRQQRAGEHYHRVLRELEDEAYDSEIPAMERYRESAP
ncbi:eCIS core domain-containing protein [Actinoplanes sp. CA-252034]|uniref:eCIS core domain-containing protein n=1 Tax=Actinoplanes sp. CA-252034 TaxID=3239906 RepID=UPI003D98115A